MVLERSVMAAKKGGSRSDLALIASRGLIDSRRLFYFYHVARSGRFTTAEALLGVAQSAISRQIQVLESDLGVQLLERTGHGVKLTPHGEILYRHAAEILDEMVQTISELEAHSNTTIEKLCVAGPPSFMSSYMPDIIARFSKLYPDIMLSAVEASTGNVYLHLANGEVDVAVVIQTPKNAKISLQKLMEEPLFLIVGKDHPLALSPQVARKKVEDLDMILPASLLGSMAIIKNYFDEEGISLRPRLEVDSLPLTRQLVAQGRMATILPKSTCTEEIRKGELVAVPLVPEPRRTVYLAELRERQSSPYLQQFIDIAIEVVSKLNK
ncbi:MAG: hypothetical protein CMN55_01850 [Sneathiella sp.]|nr:hypothetical protein [Sneathiella sp.]